ncbi:MAG TPA: DUF4352 domain-containing protein, partial [Candidatus Corynebacterium intestinavium]|nr:DUF4352 domain-containing protein [Candidatus Corynebacterium intestinavium]
VEMTSPNNQDPSSTPGQPQVIYVQEKKKGGCLKWVGIAALVLVVIVVLAVIFGDGEDGEAGSSSSNSSSAEGGKKGNEEQGPLELGQTYTTKGKLEVTVHSFGLDSNLIGESVVCADVEYANKGDKEVDFEGYWDWKVQNPNGVITDPTFTGNDDLDRGKIAAGGNHQGRVCFDGSDQGEYLIKYDPSLSFSSEKAEWKAAI